MGRLTMRMAYVLAGMGTAAAMMTIWGAIQDNRSLEGLGGILAAILFAVATTCIVIASRKGGL